METTLAAPTHVGPEEDPTGLQVNRCNLRGPFWPDSIPIDPTCPSSGSWLRNGWGRSVDMNVRGGAEDLTYFLSTGYEKETSVINWEDGDGAQSFNLRGNFQFDGFEDLQIRLNSSYRRQDIDWIPQGDNAKGSSTTSCACTTTIRKTRTPGFSRRPPIRLSTTSTSRRTSTGRPGTTSGTG